MNWTLLLNRPTLVVEALLTFKLGIHETLILYRWRSTSILFPFATNITSSISKLLQFSFIAHFPSDRTSPRRRYFLFQFFLSDLHFCFNFGGKLFLLFLFFVRVFHLVCFVFFLGYLLIVHFIWKVPEVAVLVFVYFDPIFLARRSHSGVDIALDSESKGRGFESHCDRNFLWFLFISFLTSSYDFHREID